MADVGKRFRKGVLPISAARRNRLIAFIALIILKDLMALIILTDLKAFIIRIALIDFIGLIDFMAFIILIELEALIILIALIICMDLKDLITLIILMDLKAIIILIDLIILNSSDWALLGIICWIRHGQISLVHRRYAATISHYKITSTIILPGWM